MRNRTEETRLASLWQGTNEQCENMIRIEIKQSGCFIKHCALLISNLCNMTRPCIHFVSSLRIWNYFKETFLFNFIAFLFGSLCWMPLWRIYNTWWQTQTCAICFAMEIFECNENKSWRTWRWLYNDNPLLTLKGKEQTIYQIRRIVHVYVYVYVWKLLNSDWLKRDCSLRCLTSIRYNDFLSLCEETWRLPTQPTRDW